MDDKFNKIPKDKFEFADGGDVYHDKSLSTKPVGYFRDAFNRFRKSKAAVVAAIIIALIVLFAIFAPLFNTRYDSSFMDPYYARKVPRNIALSKIGIADGTVSRDSSEKGLIYNLSIGIGAEDGEGKGGVSSKDAMDGYYQPVKKIGDKKQSAGSSIYPIKLENYLEVGFIYRQIPRSQYAEIVEWQNQTGLRVLYPLVADNGYCPDPTEANYWYKMDSRLNPLRVGADGKTSVISYNDNNFTLEDNYLRDEAGNPVYYQYAGGGSSAENAEYKVRVLYYNYYRYVNGFEPQYLFGTDSQGYDLALRLASGIKLSLLVALFVSVINLFIGAVYGAIEGYYGGKTDLIMERISDILSGMPFIVLATLFQLHFAAKVGVIPSLLFAFVLTGWIGTASTVRTQFYRFKNQEYVLAARTLGARDRRIIWKHIFPNSLGMIITSSALVIPGVIFNESMLSFLGIVNLGNSSTTSLGTLLSDASAIWTNCPHLMLFPAIVISLLMICFNLFGNGLRDAFNPGLRGTEGGNG